MTLKRGYTPVLRIIQRWRKTPYWRRARRPAAERGSVQCLLCLARYRRHACALHTLEATGDVRKVSLWLGHSSLQTTEMYLQADPTDKLDTLDKWRPPSLRKGTFKGVQDELLAMLAGT